MREKEIEQYLIKRVKAQGGVCMKFTSPGLDGVPDRMVLLPGGRIIFAELKAPGKKPRPLQKRRLKQLTGLGFACFVADSRTAIDKILGETGGDAE